MAIRPKKRDRFSMSSPPSYSSHPTSHPASPGPVADEQAEYERAVAFLAELRSRRVASAVLHSTSLDAIVESDSGLDEMLASDFSLALEVGGRSAAPGPRGTPGVGAGRGLVGLSGMRRAAASRCLLDLDDAPPSDGRRIARPVTPPTSGTECRFGFDFDGEGGPAAKRRRSLLCRWGPGAAS